MEEIIAILEEIKEILIKNKLTISTAESCTGGLLSSYLTDIDGASNFIRKNFVTYSNESKMRILGVSPETISKCSATSIEAAREMADGLLNYAQIGISTTGVMGTNTENTNVVSGTAYIGISHKKMTKVFMYRSKSEARIQQKIDVVQYALKQLLGFLKELYS